MEIRQAKRTKAKLRIGIQGPSGSGKTFSALLLGHGITGDWSRITVIDTENGSADLYAHLGEYNVLPLDPPYTPERYIAAIDAIEKRIKTSYGAGSIPQEESKAESVASVAHNKGATNATNDPHVIIIDSISHEWEGSGGILETHSNMAGNSFTNWSKLTPRHQAFINKILQSHSHMICNIRSKQEYVLAEKNGKLAPEKVGMKAISREGLDYEMTLVFELDIKNNATASKDRTGLFSGKPEFKINQVIGKRLVDWCEATSDPEIIKEKIVTCQSMEELIGIFNQYPDMQEKLRSEFIARKKSLTPNNTYGTTNKH